MGSLCQSAEVNDSFQSFRGCCLNHILCRTAIGLDKFFFLGDHGMDQIVGLPAPGSCLFEGFKVQNIALNQFHPAMPGPGTAAYFPQAAPHGTHPIAGIEQRRDQPTADVAGSSVLNGAKQA